MTTQSTTPTGTAPYIPPIVYQQIPTASRPIALPGYAPPPPPAPPLNVTEGSGSSEPGTTIGSLSDLDRGAALWLYISPHSEEDGSTDPMTDVPPLSSAPYAVPPPPVTEVPIAPYLSMEVPATVQKTGVPGVAVPQSGGGNPSLWFRNRGR